MNSIPDLNPPTKAPKTEKVKKEKAPKAEASGEKKERAPRKNYGYHLDAKISMTDKENKYRGQRKEWFDILSSQNGKTVKDFLTACEGRKDPPRGWLRFFVDDGAVTLTPPAV